MELPGRPHREEGTCSSSRQLRANWTGLRSRKNGELVGLPTTRKRRTRAQNSASSPNSRALYGSCRVTGFGSEASPQGGASRSALASCQEGGKQWKMASRESGSSVSRIAWVAALLLVLGMERALALPEICTRCPGGVHNLSRVAAYCEDTSKLMQARCCLNQKGTILGLDLQNCSLKDPGPNFLQAYTAIIIDLQANPLKDDLANTFRGFTQLQTLILPQDVPCPGGLNAWDNVTSFTDKQICQGQRDLCNSTGSQEMCPENGSCASDGPGLLQCICADGFHGYKCMRQGSFSRLMFFGILGSTTLAISILLWGTQRRKAKAS